MAAFRFSTGRKADRAIFLAGCKWLSPQDHRAIAAIGIMSPARMPGGGSIRPARHGPGNAANQSAADYWRHRGSAADKLSMRRCNIASGRTRTKALFSPSRNNGAPFRGPLARPQGRRCCENGSAVCIHRPAPRAISCASRPIEIAAFEYTRLYKMPPFPRRRFAARCSGFLIRHDRARCRLGRVPFGGVGSPAQP